MARLERLLVRILAGFLCCLVIGCSKDSPQPRESVAPWPERFDPANGGLFWRVSQDDDESASDLASLPYLGGYRAAPAKAGVTVFKSSKTDDGLNLVVSGHRPHAALMDMEGHQLHQWHYEFENAWRGPIPAYGSQVHRTFWRRVHLFPNGDLLAIFEGLCLIKLDKDSSLLWIYKGRAHHDLFVDESGLITVLIRELRNGHPGFGREGPIYEDFIVVLDPDGKELSRVSILECFLNSTFSKFLADLPPVKDLTHTNTVEVLDGRVSLTHPMFKKGDVLISIPTNGVLAVLDPEKRTVRWATKGPWGGQHQPTVLESGNLLIFDNRGLRRESRVLEFDPLTSKEQWSYRGLLSRTNCSNQRLANGNTLIVESEQGRALEVNMAGEIVWEYFNPNRSGLEEELIATIFDVVRLDESSLTPGWLARTEPKDQETGNAP